MSKQVTSFPAIPSVSHPLKSNLLEELRVLRENLRSNPLANPIELLGLEVSKRLGEGRLSIQSIDDLVQQLMGRAFFIRAERLHSYVGETNVEVNQKRIRECLHALGFKDGTPHSFEDFCNIMEREFVGIVITAHPTFSISATMNRRLAQVASLTSESGDALSEADIDAIKDLADLGMLDGVTTNPSIIAKSGKEFIPLI